MNLPRAKRRLVLQAAGAVALTPFIARAQDTLKTATIIVGSPAGGATDKMARMYADGLRGRYAENVVVENKPGAGGVIAYEGVKRSGVRDGSLVFLSPAYPIVITPHLVRNLPYDTLKDFIPVAPTGRSGMMYAVGSGVPASVRTLQDYLTWVKAHPKEAMYAAQTGSSQHLVGSVITLATGVKLDNVSYKGDAPAVQDLMGGHVPAVILPIASALPLYRQQRARILASTRAQRTRFMPDVPTFTELGYKDVLFQDWLGIFAPAGTDMGRVRQLNQLVGEVVRSPKGQEGLEQLGNDAEIVGVDQFAEMVRADHQRYQGFVQRTNFREIYERAQGK
ncbi:MAG TPA: tripartite tricarboxylate transporter substrate-binding protein [Ramlibacter sp.]|nr:tripartite tricarboxylate transporter substrate-binding protein [Ramlibacter sp.]